MMRSSFFILALSVLFVAAPAMAQGNNIKSNLDYIMDDGKMSPEEMEMEAQDMYKLCNGNIYEKTYFNCSCQAGAFLQQREKLGANVMQHQIRKIITNSAQVSPSCVNVESLAGKAFKDCMSHSLGYSETEIDRNNPEYCTCTANKFVNDFTKAPRLVMGYIEGLRSKAMTDCRDPAFRESMKAAQNANKEQAAPASPAPSLVPPKNAN